MVCVRTAWAPFRSGTGSVYTSNSTPPRASIRSAPSPGSQIRGADPFSPKCVQATAGSILSVWLRRTGDYLEMVQALKKRGFYLLATDLTGKEDISALGKQKLQLLALGNEANGLSDEVLEMSDYRLRLPTVREKAESLNVATCGAILMYLATRK